MAPADGCCVPPQLHDSVSFTRECYHRLWKRTSFVYQIIGLKHFLTIFRKNDKYPYHRLPVVTPRKCSTCFIKITMSLSPKRLNASVLKSISPPQSWSAFIAWSKPSSPPLFVTHLTHYNLVNGWHHCLSPPHCPLPSGPEEHIREIAAHWL